MLNKATRYEIQDARVVSLKLPDKYIVKGESLFERGRKYGLAVNDAAWGNRSDRRGYVRDAIKNRGVKSDPD